MACAHPGSEWKDAGMALFGKIGAFFKKYWITIAIYAAMVGIYVVIAKFDLLNAFLFPDVEKIGAVYANNMGTLVLNMLYTFQLLIPSLVIAIVIALALGTVLGMNRRVREVLHPVIYSVSVIPSILMSPFALLLAPDFRTASMFLIVYNAIWATLFATINGIMTIDRRYLDNADTLEIRGLRRMVRIVFPAAMPSIMSGLVTTLRGSFVVLVYAEMYGTQYGMGYFVRKYAEYGLYDQVWAGFIFLVVVLVVVMQLFEKFKNHVLRWTIN